MFLVPLGFGVANTKKGLSSLKVVSPMVTCFPCIALVMPIVLGWHLFDLICQNKIGARTFFL
jgi:hypothetical protein